MAEPSKVFETLEFRVVLIDPASHDLLVLNTVDGYRLPRVRVPRWLRPAQQLQKKIQATWGVHVVILSIVMADCSFGSYVVAEPLTPVRLGDFKAVLAGQLLPSELSEKECADLALLLKGELKDPFSRIGWIDHAVRWVELETGRTLASRDEIEQYNAGGAFALIRFPMTDGLDYWLKATGEPNRHEPHITKLLSEVGRGHIPDVVAWRPEWNAVLIAGRGRAVGEIPPDPKQALELLGDAVVSMARLQLQMEDHSRDLLKAGAFDQGIETLRKRAPELFDYLEEEMGLQMPVDAPHLDKRQIREIRSVFEAICERLQYLGLPETILHGDLNPGNIITGCGHCQFIDWSETYVGNCLVTLQHLLLLNRAEDADLRDFMNSVLKQRYLEVWRTGYASGPFEEGLAYMPLLGAVSALYGRGDWLASPECNDLSRQRYARTLALHMVNVLCTPELQAVCAIDGTDGFLSGATQ